MRFECSTAGRIIFGPGTVRDVVPLVRQMLGEHTRGEVLLVTGQDLDRATTLVDLLREQDLSCTTFSVSSEPTIELVRRGTRQAASQNCELVVALGGGSAIDAGKAIAALLTNRADPLEYLEVIGAGKPLTSPPKPFVAIPTTAGTGAEVTRNAVLASEEHRVKVSLRSAAMLPRLAVVDPELTYGLPPDITATTGLDALTQLIEAFVCQRANPITDALCREGIQRAAGSLRRACDGGDDPKAREDMALAALLGGITLANAGLGAVHGFAGPLGGMFSAPHGAVCAVLLPHVMAANIAALRERQPGSQALQRYEEIARILVGDRRVSAQEGIQWIQQLSVDLRIPALGHYGVTTNDLDVLIQKAATASSMKPNPIDLTQQEMKAILADAL